MQLGIAEIFDKISKLKTKEERVDELRKHNNFAIRTILQGAFDPRIEWLLPKGTPPFKKTDLPDQENILYSEARKLYLFVKGGNDNLSQLRRETLFIELLEKLSPKDADMIASIKDKKFPYKGITEVVIKEAFPGLLPDEQVQEQAV